MHTYSSPMARHRAGLLMLVGGVLACTPTTPEPAPERRVEPRQVLAPGPTARPPRPQQVQPQEPTGPTPRDDQGQPPAAYDFRCFGAPIKTPLPASPFGVRNADVNADGRLDLIGVSSDLVDGQFHHQLEVYLGQADGQFVLAAAEPYAGGGLESSVADFTGDGHPDLLIGNMYRSSFSIWRGDGRGSFAHERDHDTGAKPREPHLGDLDGDGDLDLVLPRYRQIEIHLNLGQARFRAMPKLNTAATSRMSTPENLSIGDVDGDGNLDLVVPLSDDQALEVWLGRGNGRFKRHARYEQPCSSPSHSALGHFDDDPHLDLVLGCGGLQAILVATGDGQGGFSLADARSIALPGRPSEVVATQIQGNARPEIIVAGSLAGAFEQRGSRRAREQPKGFLVIHGFEPTTGAPFEWDGAKVELHVNQGMGVEDLNDDGYPDLIYAAMGQIPGSHLATLMGQACKP